MSEFPDSYFLGDLDNANFRPGCYGFYRMVSQSQQNLPVLVNVNQQNNDSISHNSGGKLFSYLAIDTVNK